jgi:hypothetical protein
MLRLAVAPDTGGSLLVSGRIPVRVKENEAIGTDEVKAAATCLAAQ